MSKYILTNFSKDIPLEITPMTVRAMQLLMYSFETRQKHPQALNSPYLGVYPIFFTTQDQNNLFDVLGVSLNDVKKTIKKCPSIIPTFNVTSDPYNLLSIWAIHNAFISDVLNDTEKYTLSTTISKMLHYKFFTSFVNHSYPYGADESVMKAVINGLTKKFDIIEYGTWKGVLEARCEDFLDTRSIHYRTLYKFDDDKNILYILSDTQTRVRNKIKNINELYHEYKQKGDAIKNSSLNSEIDGEKLVKDIVSTYDTMLANISNDVLNINQWIDNRYVRWTCGLFPNVSQNLLRQLLTSISNTASLQSRTGKLDLVKIDEDGNELYIGIRILIKNILQKTYNACLASKVNLKSRQDILVKSRNAYSASRISDRGIINVKDSINLVIQENINISRESTIASLRIAVVIYLMFKSFEYL